MAIITAVGPSSLSSKPSKPHSANALFVILFLIILYFAPTFLISLLKVVSSVTLIPL